MPDFDVTIKEGRDFPEAFKREREKFRRCAAPTTNVAACIPDAEACREANCNPMLKAICFGMLCNDCIASHAAECSELLAGLAFEAIRNRQPLN